MRYQLIIGIILILVLPGCKSHRHTVGVMESQTDTSAVKDTIGVSATTEKDWIAMIFAADSISCRLCADSIVTPSGGTLYNPRIDIGAMRPTIKKERHSERTENSLAELHESIRHTATVAENREEEKGVVTVAEPITKSVWRWAIICVCFVVSLLLLYRKR